MPKSTVEKWISGEEEIPDIQLGGAPVHPLSEQMPPTEDEWLDSPEAEQTLKAMLGAEVPEAPEAEEWGGIFDYGSPIPDIQIAPPSPVIETVVPHELPPEAAASYEIAAAGQTLEVQEPPPSPPEERVGPEDATDTTALPGNARLRMAEPLRYEREPLAEGLVSPAVPDPIDSITDPRDRDNVEIGRRLKELVAISAVDAPAMHGAQTTEVLAQLFWRKARAGKGWIESGGWFSSEDAGFKVIRPPSVDAPVAEWMESMTLDWGRWSADTGFGGDFEGPSPASKPEHPGMETLSEEDAALHLAKVYLTPLVWSGRVDPALAQRVYHNVDRLREHQKEWKPEDLFAEKPSFAENPLGSVIGFGQIMATFPPALLSSAGVAAYVDQVHGGGSVPGEPHAREWRIERTRDDGRRIERFLSDPNKFATSSGLKEFVDDSLDAGFPIEGLYGQGGVFQDMAHIAIREGLWPADVAERLLPENLKRARGDLREHLTTQVLVSTGPMDPMDRVIPSEYKPIRMLSPGQVEQIFQSNDYLSLHENSTRIKGWDIGIPGETVEPPRAFAQEWGTVMEEAMRIWRGDQPWPTELHDGRRWWIPQIHGPDWAGSFEAPRYPDGNTMYAVQDLADWISTGRVEALFKDGRFGSALAAEGMPKIMSEFVRTVHAMDRPNSQKAGERGYFSTHVSNMGNEILVGFPLQILTSWFGANPESLDKILPGDYTHGDLWRDLSNVVGGHFKEISGFQENFKHRWERDPEFVVFEKTLPLLLAGRYAKGPLRKVLHPKNVTGAKLAFGRFIDTIRQVKTSTNKPSLFKESLDHLGAMMSHLRNNVPRNEYKRVFEDSLDNWTATRGGNALPQEFTRPEKTYESVIPRLERKPIDLLQPSELDVVKTTRERALDTVSRSLGIELETMVPHLLKKAHKRALDAVKNSEEPMPIGVVGETPSILRRSMNVEGLAEILAREVGTVEGRRLGKGDPVGHGAGGLLPFRHERGLSPEAPGYAISKTGPNTPALIGRMVENVFKDKESQSYRTARDTAREYATWWSEHTAERAIEKPLGPSTVVWKSKKAPAREFREWRDRLRKLGELAMEEASGRSTRMWERHQARVKRAKEAKKHWSVVDSLRPKIEDISKSLSEANSTGDTAKAISLQKELDTIQGKYNASRGVAEALHPRPRRGDVKDPPVLTTDMRSRVMNDLDFAVKASGLRKTEMQNELNQARLRDDIPTIEFLIKKVKAEEVFIKTLKKLIEEKPERKRGRETYSRANAARDYDRGRFRRAIGKEMRQHAKAIVAEKSARQRRLLENKGKSALDRHESEIARLYHPDHRMARNRYRNERTLRKRADLLARHGVLDPHVYRALFKDSGRKDVVSLISEFVSKARESELSSAREVLDGLLAKMAEWHGMTVGEYLRFRKNEDGAYVLAERGIADPNAYAFLGLPDRRIDRFVRYAKGEDVAPVRRIKPTIIERGPEIGVDPMRREVPVEMDPYSDRKYSADTPFWEYLAHRFLGSHVVSAAKGRPGVGRAARGGTAHLPPSQRQIYAVAEFMSNPFAFVDIPGHFRDLLMWANAKNPKRGGALLKSAVPLFLNQSAKLGPSARYANRQFVTQRELSAEMLGPVLKRLERQESWDEIHAIENIMESAGLAGAGEWYSGHLKGNGKYVADAATTNVVALAALHGAENFKFPMETPSGTKMYTTDPWVLKLLYQGKWMSPSEVQSLVNTEGHTARAAYGGVESVGFHLKDGRRFSELDYAQKTIGLILNDLVRPAEQVLWEHIAQLNMAQDALRMEITSPLKNAVVSTSTGEILAVFEPTKAGAKKAISVREKMGPEHVEVKAVDPVRELEFAELKRREESAKTSGDLAEEGYVRSMREDISLWKDPVVTGRLLRDDVLGTGIVRASEWMSHYYDATYTHDMLINMAKARRDGKMSDVEWQSTLDRLDLLLGKTFPDHNGRKASTIIDDYRSKGREAPGREAGQIPHHIERFDRIRRWKELSFEEMLAHGLFDYREAIDLTVNGLSHNLALSKLMTWLRKNGMLLTTPEVTEARVKAGDPGRNTRSGLSYVEVDKKSGLLFPNDAKGFWVEERALGVFNDMRAAREAVLGVRPVMGVGAKEGGALAKGSTALGGVWRRGLGAWKLGQVVNFTGGTVLRAIYGNGLIMGQLAEIPWKPTYAGEYLRDVRTMRSGGKPSPLYMQIRTEGFGGATFASEMQTPMSHLQMQFDLSKAHTSLLADLKTGTPHGKKVSAMTEVLEQKMTGKIHDAYVEEVALHRMKRPLRETELGRSAEMGRTSKGMEMGRKGYEAMRKSYGFIDDTYKGAYIYQLVRDHGMTIREAIRTADRTFMDYPDVAPMLDFGRRSMFAMADWFMTFHVKWAFMINEAMALRPMRAFALATLHQSLMRATQSTLNLPADYAVHHEMITGESLSVMPTVVYDRNTDSDRRVDSTDQKLSSLNVGPMALDLDLLIPGPYPSIQEEIKRRRRAGLPVNSFRSIEDAGKSLVRVALGGEKSFYTAFIDDVFDTHGPDPRSSLGKIIGDEGNLLLNIVSQVPVTFSATIRHGIAAWSAFKGRPVKVGTGEINRNTTRAVSNFAGLSMDVLDYHHLKKNLSRAAWARTQPHADKLAAAISVLSGTAPSEADPPEQALRMMNAVKSALEASANIKRIEQSEIALVTGPFKRELIRRVRNWSASYSTMVRSGQIPERLHKSLLRSLPEGWDKVRGVDAGIETSIAPGEVDGENSVYSRWAPDRELTTTDRLLRELGEESGGGPLEAKIQSILDLVEQIKENRARGLQDSGHLKVNE